MSRCISENFPASHFRVHLGVYLVFLFNRGSVGKKGEPQAGENRMAEGVKLMPPEPSTGLGEIYHILKFHIVFFQNDAWKTTFL